MECKTCGAQIDNNSTTCPYCSAHVTPQSTGTVVQSAVTVPSTSSVGVPAGPTASNKVSAGVWGIILGSLGIHKFVLGYTTAGFIMLGVSVITCGAGALLMGLIGLIEGIIYLTKSDEDFVKTYVINKKEWF